MFHAPMLLASAGNGVNGLTIRFGYISDDQFPVSFLGYELTQSDWNAGVQEIFIPYHILSNNWGKYIAIETANAIRYFYKGELNQQALNVGMVLESTASRGITLGDLPAPTSVGNCIWETNIEIGG